MSDVPDIVDKLCDIFMRAARETVNGEGDACWIDFLALTLKEEGYIVTYCENYDRLCDEAALGRAVREVINGNS